MSRPPLRKVLDSESVDVSNLLWNVRARWRSNLIIGVVMALAMLVCYWGYPKTYELSAIVRLESPTELYLAQGDKIFYGRDGDGLMDECAPTLTSKTFLKGFYEEQIQSNPSHEGHRAIEAVSVLSNKQNAARRLRMRGRDPRALKSDLGPVLSHWARVCRTKIAQELEERLEGKRAAMKAIQAAKISVTKSNLLNHIETITAILEQRKVGEKLPSKQMPSSVINLAPEPGLFFPYMSSDVLRQAKDMYVDAHKSLERAQQKPTQHPELVYLQGAINDLPEFVVAIDSISNDSLIYPKSSTYLLLTAVFFVLVVLVRAFFLF